MSVYSDPTPNPVAAVVILAAGEGKRMKSSRSKLLHEIAGHSMLSYAVTAATAVRAGAHRRRRRSPARSGRGPSGRDRAARADRGPGGAARHRPRRAGRAGQLADLTGDVIVTFGDVPMLTGETLAALLIEHRARQAGGHRADGAGSRPDRLRPDPARRRRLGERHRRAPRRR